SRPGPRRVGRRDHGPGAGPVPQAAGLNAPATGPGSQRFARVPGMPDPAGSAPPLRVLVVDDNRDAADCLVDLLLATGYQAEAAYDAPGALELAPRLRPQVAVVDIGLPLIDGYELARRLRERG